VSIKNDGTAASGNVILHLKIQSNPTPGSFDVVKSADIILGTIQNDSICIDTPSAYQVNVSSSANEGNNILLWITIYESAVPKKTFAFVLQVPPAGM
jgi:hypothetical protein